MEYLLIALILLIAVIVIVVLAMRVASHTFQCSHCSKSFRIKWPKVIITEHSGNAYMMECPLCKAKDWCIQQPKP